MARAKPDSVDQAPGNRTTERPTEVLVGPAKYRILWTLGESNRRRHADRDAPLAGITYYHEETIQMNEDASGSYARRVLVHEILHIIIDNVGGLGIPPKVMTEDEVIERLQSGILDLLRRNPALLAWLAEETP